MNECLKKKKTKPDDTSEKKYTSEKKTSTKKHDLTKTNVAF
jgi:hypothetical protein